MSTGEHGEGRHRQREEPRSADVWGPRAGSGYDDSEHGDSEHGDSEHEGAESRTVAGLRVSAPSLPTWSAGRVVAGGLAFGTALAIVAVLRRPDGAADAGWLGWLGAVVVAGVLTGTLVRRMVTQDPRPVTLAGGLASAAVGVAALGPDWLVHGVLAYVVAAAGAVAVLLTRPVRGLAVLVIEYAVAFGVSIAGAAAVSGLIGGADLALGMSAAAVVVAFGVLLLLATWIRSRLLEGQPTTGDQVFIAVFLVATLIAVSAIAVIVVSGGWEWARTAGGVTVLIGCSLALLGVGCVVRSWTPSGWWVSAPAGLGAAAVTIAVGAGSMRSLGAAMLGVTIGFVVGVVLTLAVAVLIGMLVRANRAGRGNLWRSADEPGRLAPLG